MILVIVGTGCSSDDAGSESSGSDDQQMTEDGGAGTAMDQGFDLASLPDDFPDTLVPDSFTSGTSGELGGVRTVGFESRSSFDALVAEYNDKIGSEPTIAQGEERVAIWPVPVDGWAVSLAEGPLTLIGFTFTG